jgi:vitamin B12 transporter
VNKSSRFCLIFFLLPNCILAQINDSTKVLPSAEITAVRLARYAIGQQQISIDSTNLKVFELQNIGDLLQNLTPLSIKSYGIGLSTATTRGTGSRHTALIWNGLNIQNGLIGLSDLSALEVGAVDKMYVKFGGTSALFGSGAMGGAIFLDNALENTKGFSGNAGLNAGSFGLLGQQIKLKMGNENIAGQIRISHQKAANNFEFRDIFELGKPIKYAQNAAFDKLNITNSLLFNLGKNRFLKINNWLSDIYREIPPQTTAATSFDRQIEQSFRSVAEFSGPLSIKAIFKSRIGFFNEKLNYESVAIKNSENNIRTFIGEAETVINLSENTSLRLGFNFTNNKTASNNLGDKNHERNRFALFASQIFAIKKMKFAANIRQEVIDNQLVPFVFSVGVEKPCSLRLVAFNLRSSFSRNYNIPSLNDLYWRYLGNPNLKSENGFSGELGIDFLRKNVNSTTSLGFTLFALKTTNWIEWKPNNGSLFTPSNLSKVFGRGVELVVKNQLEFNNKIVLKTHFNYQLSRSTDAADSLNRQLIYTPIHAGSAGFNLVFKHFYANYYQNASSERRMSGTDFTQPFTIGNLTFGHSFFIKKCTLNAALNVLNIWNTDYQVIQFYAQPRRNFNAQLSVNF